VAGWVATVNGQPAGKGVHPSLLRLIRGPSRRHAIALGAALVVALPLVLTICGGKALDSTPAVTHLGSAAATRSTGAQDGSRHRAWSAAFLDATLPAPAMQMRGHPVVYLTFDDGPSPQYTAALLHVLARHGAKATFFIIGETAAAFPDLVRKEIAAGDSIGDHTWTHPHLTTLSRAAITAQLGRTQDLIRSLGAPARCFRPPHGETDSKVLSVARSLHLHQYLWSTITNDFAYPSTADSLSRALAGLHPGAIIVFHDWVSQSLAAVDQFLTIAGQLGYIAAPLPC
jgi:peptidoglycan-N-acetylglucosamine deacetylase